jgi:hypothetical protein
VLVSTTAAKDSSEDSVTPLANQKPCATTCVLPVPGLYESSRPEGHPCAHQHTSRDISAAGGSRILVSCQQPLTLPSLSQSSWVAPYQLA